MTLNNFLKMHQNGVACVSIQQMSYIHGLHRYAKTYFEEDYQDDILESALFKTIKNMQVDHFNVIGGGSYKVELCIYLSE